MCSSKESSVLVTQATPPCAHAVLESTPLRFVIIATRPCLAALIAKVRPAIPLPMTTKSYSFIGAECYRSGAFCRRKPRRPEASEVRSLGEAASGQRRRFRHNRSERGELIQFVPEPPRELFSPIFPPIALPSRARPECPAPVPVPRRSGFG